MALFVLASRVGRVCTLVGFSDSGGLGCMAATGKRRHRQNGNNHNGSGFIIPIGFFPPIVLNTKSFLLSFALSMVDDQHATDRLCSTSLQWPVHLI